MKTVKFKYDAEKYCVKNFLDNAELLSRSVWVDNREGAPHDNRDLKIVNVEGSMATCAYTKYDNRVGKLVELTVKIPIENLELRASMAVEFEYEKILSSIDEEKAAIIRGLVWEKERDAAVAGYNGCI